MWVLSFIKVNHTETFHVVVNLPQACVNWKWVEVCCPRYSCFWNMSRHLVSSRFRILTFPQIDSGLSDLYYWTVYRSTQMAYRMLLFSEQVKVAELFSSNVKEWKSKFLKCTKRNRKTYTHHASQPAFFPSRQKPKLTQCILLHLNVST